MGGVSIGVIGVGSLGFHHARILSDMPGVRMTGVFDSDGERAREVSSQLNVHRAESIEALLTASDGVVIAVPTHLHAEVAVQALAAQVDVLVEKPLAASLPEADRILAEAEESGSCVLTGHVERFNSAVLAAMPYMDTPLFIESHRMAPFQPRGIDIAVVSDLMIHDVDLVCALAHAQILEVAATGVPVLTSSVDIANARITFQGGAVANLTASRISLERTRKLRVFQPSGYISLDLAEGRGEFLRLKQELPLFRDGAWEGLDATDLQEIVERIPLEGDSAEPLRRELEHFEKVVRRTEEPLVSGWDGREALAVSLLIEKRIRDHVAHTRET